MIRCLSFVEARLFHITFRFENPLLSCSNHNRYKDDYSSDNNKHYVEKYRMLKI